MQNKHVLVTGGAGFIGSHLVRQLVREGAVVRVLDNLSSGIIDRLRGLDVDFIEGDVRDPNVCAQAVRGCEYVFHMAAYISVPGSMTNSTFADSVNIDGTRNMILAAKAGGVRRFIFSSSAAVYGNAATPIEEDALPIPTSPYGVGKLCGEHFCRIFSKPGVFEATALRYFNVYGPEQNPNSEYAAVIPTFINFMLQGKTPTIYGDGEQTRDFLFVDDVVRANIAAAKRRGSSATVFNVASGKPTTINELFVLIAQIVGYHEKPNYCYTRDGDTCHSFANASLARKELGFTAKTSLTTGLRETVESYMAQLNKL